MSLVPFRVYRDVANDNLAVDAMLIGGSWHVHEDYDAWEVQT